MEHKSVKALYTKTNGKGFEAQIARKVRRIEQMRSIRQAIDDLRESWDRSVNKENRESKLMDPFLITAAPHSHYHIGTSKKDYIDILQYHRVENCDFATVVRHYSSRAGFT
jgi:hypothetical protein